MASTEKSVLITGGTQGIGFELAKLFAKDGFHLVLVARNSDGRLQAAAQELQQDFGVEVLTIEKDLFHPNAPFEIYDELHAKGIWVHMLVNNAAQGYFGEFVETDIRRELDIIQLNISAAVVLTKLFLQDMVRRGEGRILNVSSIAGKIPGPWQAVYHGTKAFVHSFTEAIRNENKATGVSITSLLPGATATDFFNKADMQESKIVQDEYNLADPAEVALDGYKALMDGDDMVVSGMKNKVMVGLANVLPDSTATENMRKQQEPVNRDED